METSEPNIEVARKFAKAIHAKFPGKLLAYNCSPSFNWKKKLDDASIATFREQLNAMGYKFQFITLAGFHALNYSFFELARDFKERGMSAYAEFQQLEFAAESRLYRNTPPARGRNGLLRRSRADDQRGSILDDRAARFDRSRAVL